MNVATQDGVEGNTSGALSVGVGVGIDEAVDNGRSDRALYADYVGDGLDGFMSFEELRP